MKLGKQDFHYDMEEVFEPVTVKQADATKNQKRDSSQTTIQTIQESSNALNKKLQKSV